LPPLKEVPILKEFPFRKKKNENVSRSDNIIAAFPEISYGIL
jgi:hypothetical protein